MMSGVDCRESALAAGANAFLTSEEWLMVGNHVAALLANPRGDHRHFKTLHKTAAVRTILILEDDESFP